MILVIGYGNPGRLDDGLGPAFAARVGAAGLPGVAIRQDYQLTVEHALELVGVDIVVFADAAMDVRMPFELRRIVSAGSGQVASHSLSPEALLGLAATLFGAAPEAHVMAIAGAEFGEVGEGLSPEAARNLDRAVEHFTAWAARRAEEAVTVD